MKIKKPNMELLTKFLPGGDFRWTISTQMYLVLAVFVVLIFTACFLGWRQIRGMNDIQRRVNGESIPKLTLATTMGQESVALTDISGRLVSAASQKEVDEVETIIERHAENLSWALKSLGEIDGGGQELSSQLEEHSQNLIGNLKDLEESVEKSIGTREQLNGLLSRALEEARAMEKLLTAEIDDHTFLIYTGWESFEDKTQQSRLTPDAGSFMAFMRQNAGNRRLVTRTLRQNRTHLDYYRGLLSFETEGQAMLNILNQAMQLSDADFIQPLRERFLGALESVTQSMILIPENDFKKRVVQAIESIKAIGVGLGGDGEGGLFHLLEEFFQEKKLQQNYLGRNQEIVGELAARVEGIIGDIQEEGNRTSRTFEEAIARNYRDFIVLTLVSILLAIFVGYAIVYRYLIGRIKRLSAAVLTMAQGNLQIDLKLQGNDEITDMGNALEVFRRYAVEAQRLDLAEKLAGELQDKNGELEKTIGKLQQAQERIVAQEKLASLGQLTSGIAHEIKNPLNFINNFSKISRELIGDIQEEIKETGEKLTEEAKLIIEETLEMLTNNLEKIHFHGERTNDIVKGMLQHSRGDAEDFKERVRISRFLDSAINLAYQGKRTANSDFNVDIQKNYGEGLENCELEVNPQEISRVVLNIVTNACDAIEDKTAGLSKEQREAYGPFIRIELVMVEIAGKEMVRITITDNGPGIPSEIIEKVFNPFFTTKPTNKGTGLGLSLSHDIILKHEGNLRVESEPGNTVFTIELPLT